MSTLPAASSSEEEVTIKYVCGMDIGSQSCAGCIWRPDKRVVVKPSDFANTFEGWRGWEEKLEQLDAAPNHIMMGREATSRYHENLYQELEQQGYQMRLLHPGQTHHFHQQQGRLTKTDRLDAPPHCSCLAESGRHAWAMFQADQIATYRELVRLHTPLSEEAARYQNQIQALGGVLFPEFSQIFVDPCGQAALAVLKTYPHAQAVAQAGVEAMYQVLRSVPAAHFGRPTAKKWVVLAQASSRSGRALSGRESHLRILCDQLEHTQANLQRLEEELEQLSTTDPETKGLRHMPELGPKTVAVLRAETFGGQALCSHRPSHRLRWDGYPDQRERPVEGPSQAFQAREWLDSRQILYLAATRSSSLEDSAFGAYYHHLVARGRKSMSALMAVRRKMVAVATHLMKTGEDYDRSLVWVSLTS